MPCASKHTSPSSSHSEQDYLASLSIKVFCLRLQVNNLSLQGNRQQMLTRLRGAVVPRKSSKATSHKRAKHAYTVTHMQQQDVSTTMPLDDEQASFEGSVTVSEHEAQLGSQASFSLEQIAVIQNTVQASPAAW